MLLLQQEGENRFMLRQHIFLPCNIFIFFKLGFTLCKAKQPLQGMELQEKKHKKD